MKLRHPNIVEVIEMLESPDHLMLIMPYARHGDLLDYLNRRGTLLEDEAAAIVLQLISALKYAHSQNLIHFDVKLVRKETAANIALLTFCQENILCMDKNVSGEERVVLADWGCAYDYKTSDRSAEKIPRPVQYSSPERNDILLGTISLCV
jgi:calcium/calmodulin-dependent protein kinase I